MTLKHFLPLVLIIGIAYWIFSSSSPLPLAIIFAVVIHEVGHYLFSLINNSKLKSFKIRACGFSLGGSRLGSSYLSEASIAFGGPLFSLLSSLIASLGTSPAMLLFGEVSLAFGVFNLLPIDGFDGEKILRCLLLSFLSIKPATIICECASFLSAFFVWCISVYQMIRSGREVTFFIFSAITFFGLFLKAPKERICEIIKE